MFVIAENCSYFKYYAEWFDMVIMQIWLFLVYITFFLFSWWNLHVDEGLQISENV